MADEAAAPTLKRTQDDAGLVAEDGIPAKQPRTTQEGDPSFAEDDDLDALLDGQGGDLLGDTSTAFGAVEPADEVARRSFADRVTKAKRVTDTELPDLIGVLQRDAPSWEAIRRWRSSALLLVCVARSSRQCRGAFIADGGLQLLGALLQQALAALEGGEAVARQEAGMWILACLSCLSTLPLGRATLWEHRQAIGKPFDRLHKWCAKERSALAAELRAPTNALCKRWRRQPRPASQESAPEQKASRRKVVELITQGLAGISGGNSPASPFPMSLPSPGCMPGNLIAAEVEAALFGLHGGVTHEYKVHTRMLRSNLGHPRNAKLRERVLSGDLSAEELVAMDSAHLASDELQEQRRVMEKKAMKDVVVENYLVRLPSRGDDRAFGATAPPVFVRAGSASSDLAGSKENIPTDGDTNKPMPPPTPGMQLEPPPTPFRDASMGIGQHLHDDEPPPTPGVLMTPAHDDENEETEALIRYLTKPVSV